VFEERGEAHSEIFLPPRAACRAAHMPRTLVTLLPPFLHGKPPLSSIPQPWPRAGWHECLENTCRSCSQSLSSCHQAVSSPVQVSGLLTDTGGWLGSRNTCSSVTLQRHCRDMHTNCIATNARLNSLPRPAHHPLPNRFRGLKPNEHGARLCFRKHRKINLYF
jgi:hypothetical protein